MESVRRIKKGNSAYRIRPKKVDLSDKIFDYALIPQLIVMVSFISTKPLVDGFKGTDFERIALYMSITLVLLGILVAIGYGIYRKITLHKRLHEQGIDKNEFGFDPYGIHLKDLNKMYIVNETDDNIGIIRRLYCILESDEDGYIRLTDDARELKYSEDFKTELCNDVEITKKDWRNIARAFVEISQTKSIKNKIEESNKLMEYRRKDLKEEYSKKDDFIRKYIESNGNIPHPTSLERDRELLKNELKQLDNKMEQLGEEYSKIPKMEKVK